MKSGGVGETASGRVGEWASGRWRDGEMGRWRDGEWARPRVGEWEMERWKVAEMGNGSKAELRGQDLHLDNRAYMLSPAITANGASILIPVYMSFRCRTDEKTLQKRKKSFRGSCLYNVVIL